MSLAVDTSVPDAAAEPLLTRLPDAAQAGSGRGIKNHLATSAATTAGVMMVKVLIVFVVTPVLVHGLGDTRYGIWMLVGSITSYLLLAEFGMKNAAIRYVAQCDGLKDDAGINRIVNTSLFLLTAVGAAVLLAGLVVARFWRQSGEIPDELMHETQVFIVLQGLLIALLLPLGAPHSLLAGLGQFPARNLASLLSLIFRNGLLVAVVWCHGTLVAIGAALLLTCAFDYLALFWMARRCFPHLSLSYRFVDRATLWRLSRYGANTFTADIAHLACAQSAPLIIGAVLASSASITYFSLGASLKDYALTVLGSMVLVIMPAVSKWDATNNYAAIRSVFAHATRYALYLTMPVEIGLLALGRPFLALWIGSHYADMSSTTLTIISAPIALAAGGLVATRILQGIGKVRPLAVVVVIQAILTVTLSMALAGLLGIEGVALGTAFAVAACAATTILLACRFVDLGIRALLVQSFAKPLAATAVAAPVWIGSRMLFPIDSWIAFTVVVVVGAMLYAAMVLLLEADVRRAARDVTRRFASALRSARDRSRAWLANAQ